jgi:hypothetical protein
MEEVLTLIDSVLRYKKIRYAYEDGLYSLFIGSFFAYIQVDGNNCSQYFIQSEDNGDGIELYYEYVDTENNIFTKDEIEEEIDAMLDYNKNISRDMTRISNLLQSIDSIVVASSIPKHIVDSLYNEIITDIN